MSNISLVVFDLDGTLIKSKINYLGIRNKIREILKELVSAEEFQKIQETPTTILRLVEMVKEKDSTGILYKKAWDIVKAEEQMGYETAEIDEDVHSTLQSLKESKHTITIFTNNSRELTEFGMDKFNLNQYAEMIITRDDVKNAKPDPEGLKIIMDSFGKRKDETIFIGDSWLDAETAQIAGVDFIYFGDSGAPGTRRKKIEVKKIINNLTELLNLL